VSLLFSVRTINSNGNTVHFNSWPSSAAVIGAIQLTMTDLDFVHALENLGSEILKLAWRLQSELSKDFLNSGVIHKRNFFRC